MKGDWKTVAVKKTLLLEVERVLLTKTAKETGLLNAAQFVDIAIREMIKTVGLRRFELVDVHDDHVSIIDSKVEPLGTIVHVYLRETQLWCDFCDECMCVHIQYMWEVPKLRRVLENHGFKSMPPSYADSDVNGAGQDAEEEEASKEDNSESKNEIGMR